MKNQKFLDLLVASKILTRDDVVNLGKKFEGDAEQIMNLLIEGNASPRSVVGKLWGDSLNTAYVDLNKTLFQAKAVELLPMDYALKNHIIPIYRMADTVTVAAADPTDYKMLNTASNIMGYKVSAVFSFRDEIEDAVGIEYQSNSKLDEFMNKLSKLAIRKGTSKITEAQIRDMAGEEAMIEFSRSLLLLAIKERASDIHIEANEEYTRIRLRVDGICQDRLKIESTLHTAIVTRFKVMGGLDIADKRQPQDGRVSLKLKNRSIDYRISVIPTIYGERIVIRLLGQKDPRVIPEIEELDFSADNIQAMKKMSKFPNGIFFVTGPTGSGKTTTLFSVLKFLNSPDVNIMTIEDPIEYQLDGVSQTQVKSDIGLTFGKLLRSYLRQDPDIILIGEIRDEETARIAAQAALTGHLVVSTMHTNSSLQAVTRLLEIGLEPFILAPSMIGVMAQRLVRKICEHCKEKYKLEPIQIEQYFEWDGKSDVYFYRGKGCEECGGSGYSGRLAIHEILHISNDMRRLIAKDANVLDFKEYLDRSKFKSLRYDGIKKALRGLTTIEEVNRVTFVEDDFS